MSWTYINTMDEYDKEVSKDSSTSNRYTFNRYMYFKPDQYESWSKKQSYTGVPYTAELVGNANIPSAGTYLSGSLSNFYVNDVLSIKNMSTELHGDACSYAVVTIEYLNKKQQSSGDTDSGGSSSSQSDRSLPPWQQNVDDFSCTNQQIAIPFTEGYLVNTSPYNLIAFTTTAGQPIYGYTTDVWIQKYTWTYKCKDGDYDLERPVINDYNITWFNGAIQIPSGNGLLMPPSYKKKYYTGGTYTNLPYDLWSFEVIRNPLGFNLKVLNAGTKAIVSGNLIDICSWYVYLPSGNVAPQKKYGSFNDMMQARNQVLAYNKNILDLTQRKVWNGDYCQSPVPLTDTGLIDFNAISNPALTYELEYVKYDFGGWNIGGVN